MILKTVYKIVLPCLLITTLFGFTEKPEWKNLLDKNLTQWEMYLSYRHKPGYNGKVPIDANGKEIKPVGYNKNEAGVFTVIEEKGEPVLRVSGEIYGCVFTKAEYKNYHLKAKVRWGEKNGIRVLIS